MRLATIAVFLLAMVAIVTAGCAALDPDPAVAQPIREHRSSERQIYTGSNIPKKRDDARRHGVTTESPAVLDQPGGQPAASD